MPTFPSFITGLTLAALALHTAVSVAPQNGLSDLRKAIVFEGGGEPFYEHSAHVMPRLISATTADFRENAPRRGCASAIHAGHAHLFCDGGGMDDDGLESRPGRIRHLWSAHAALDAEDEDAPISGG